MQKHSFNSYLSEDSKSWNEVSFNAALKKKHKDNEAGGRADKNIPSDFDQTELKIGSKVEFEHTNNMDLALEIAMDHLVEIKDYYTRLDRMEKNAKSGDEE